MNFSRVMTLGLGFIFHKDMDLISMHVFSMTIMKFRPIRLGLYRSGAAERVLQSWSVGHVPLNKKPASSYKGYSTQSGKLLN